MAHDRQFLHLRAGWQTPSVMGQGDGGSALRFGKFGVTFASCWRTGRPFRLRLGLGLACGGTLLVVMMHSAASGGTCVETTPGSGVFECSGAASPTGLDADIRPPGTSSRRLETVAGFGIDSSNVGPTTCVGGLWTCGTIVVNGTTGSQISFVDQTQSLIKGRRGGFSSNSLGADVNITTTGVVEGQFAGIALHRPRNTTLQIDSGSIRATDTINTTARAIEIAFRSGSIDADIAEGVEILGGVGDSISSATSVTSNWDIAGNITSNNPQTSAFGFSLGSVASSQFVLRQRGTSRVTGNFGYFLIGSGNIDVEVEAGAEVFAPAGAVGGGAGFIVISLNNAAAVHRFVNAGRVEGSNKGFNIGGSSQSIFFENSGEYIGGSLGVEIRNDGPSGGRIDVVNTGVIRGNAAQLPNPGDRTRLYSGSGLFILNNGGVTDLDLGGDISGAFHGAVIAADGYPILTDGSGNVTGVPPMVAAGPVSIVLRGLVTGGAGGGSGDGIRVEARASNPSPPSYEISVVSGRVTGGMPGQGPFTGPGALVASGAAVSTELAGAGRLSVEQGAELDGRASGVAVVDGSGAAEIVLSGRVLGDVRAGGGQDLVFVGSMADVDGDIDLGFGDDVLVLDLDPSGRGGLVGTGVGGGGFDSLIYSLQSGSLVLGDEAAGSGGVSGFETISKTGAGDLTFGFTPSTTPSTVQVLEEQLRLSADLTVADTGSDPLLSGRLFVATTVTGSDFAELQVGDGSSPVTLDVARGLYMQGASRVEVASGAALRLGPEGLTGNNAAQSVAVAGQARGDIALGSGDDRLDIMAGGGVEGRLGGSDGGGDILDWQLANGASVTLAETDALGFEDIRLRGLGTSGASGFTLAPPSSGGFTLDAGSDGTDFGSISLLDGLRLSGTGSLRGNVLLGSASRMGPGLSPGILSVTGSLTQQAGSIYDVDIVPVGPGKPVDGAERPTAGVTHDLVQVSGNARLEPGAGVVVMSSESSAEWLDALGRRVAATGETELRYRILEADDLSGVWTSNVSLGVLVPETEAPVDLPDLLHAPGLAARDAAAGRGPLLTYLSYDATGADVVVRLVLPSKPPALPGLGDAGLISAGAGLFTLPVGDPEFCGTWRFGGNILCRQRRPSAQDGTADGPELLDRELVFWGEVFGYGGTLSDAEERADWTMSGVKLKFGGNPEFTGPDMFLGAMLAVGRGSLDLAVTSPAGNTVPPGGALESDSWAVSGFAQWDVNDRVRLNTVLGYGWHDVDQNRTSLYAGDSERLVASYTATQWTLDLAARVGLLASDNQTLVGGAGVTYGAFRRPAYVEDGAALGAFSANASQYESLQTTLGLEVERSWGSGADADYGFQARLAWVREHGDRITTSEGVYPLTAHVSSLDGLASFERAADAVNAGIRFSAKTTDLTALSLDLAGTWAGADQSSWRAELSLEHRW
ncbi:MAG: hypothetical protein RLZZ413_3256 [Pseudomonadota bacterium]